ncbi:uncharacterized protein LOC142598108 [Dermatophagoides farinae]|uniref:uncharacterized protein LOC142598108 n=1 Tax=Dermatophagoides farinae TaxID=6954 RepID=UPI003F62A5A3
MRWAKELPASYVRKIVTCDLDPTAVATAKLQHDLNGIPASLMEIQQGDINYLLFKNKYENNIKFDVIDLDPYGSIAPFLDSAISNIKDRGLLCVTSTDMCVLGANIPEVCFSKYCGTATKRPFLHEASVRIVLNAMRVVAGKYGKFIKPLISLSVDFYVRIFVLVLNKPSLCKSNAYQTGLVRNCVNCSWYEVQGLGDACTLLKKKEKNKKRRLGKQNKEEETEEPIKPESVTPFEPILGFRNLPLEAAYTVARFQTKTNADKCPECNNKTELTGPMYTGPLHDQEFVSQVIAEISKIKQFSDNVDTSFNNQHKIERQNINVVTDDSNDRNKLVDNVKNRFNSDKQTFVFTHLSKKTFPKISGLLNVIKEDLDDIPLFYNLPLICKNMKLSVPKQKLLLSALLNIGYRIGLFHREPLSIKTDAPFFVLKDLIHYCIEFTNPADATKDYNILHSQVSKLQQFVNSYIDGNKSQDKSAPAGVRQWLEKKSGAVRQKMMGKRVNYAARTIIAPDCQIDTNEIGIPKEFAMKLSVPIFASLDNLDKIEGKPFILRRHLKNGDTVLMNRQPSLHKPSILAHFVRVLENQKCFRLHYTNCSGYNADFDGDEMNLHCLQNPTAQVEAAILMNADTNYTNPRNGAPLRGLIQDHIVSGALLTVKGTFLKKDEYLQIIYSAVAKYVCIEPPTIFYPVQLWTGKQVISSLLKTIVDYGINLQTKSKTPVTAWRGIITTDNDEATVVIQNSELLQGVFDKNQYGASFNGLVHVCSELLNARVAGILLSCFSRAFTTYIQFRGFTCGLADFELNRKVFEQY